MSYTIRPISDRTAFQGKHRRSQFEASWPTTERLLLSEVAKLKGRDLVIEADIVESDIRIDGRLRATARPATPAIRVAFDSMYGGLAYATDTFGHWQDNVRAIALGLEALRKVDRYGITRRGEQYAGWKQLPAGSGADDSQMTREDARAILIGYMPTNGTLIQAWKAARQATHPDRNDGDQTLWDQVEQAARVLGVAS